MKKIFTLAFVALTLLVTACGKSNNDSPSPQDDAKKALIGTWYLVSSTDAGEDVKLTECDKQEHIVITEDSYTIFEALNISNNCTIKESKNTFSILGDKLTVGKSVYAFSVSGNKLILTYTEKDEDGEEVNSIDTYEKR
jgi:lipoprotein